MEGAFLNSFYKATLTLESKAMQRPNQKKKKKEEEKEGEEVENITD